MFLPVVLAATGIGRASEDVQGGLAGKIAEFFDFLIGRVPSWIAGFLVFALAFVAAKIAKSAVESRISSQVDEEHQDVLILAGRVTYYGTLMVGITIALQIAGIDLTALLAAVAFGIGFALRDLIMNFLAGVFILVSRQFIIGDFIKVGSTVGKVVEIQTRATILKAVDGTKVIVPNSEIFTNQVVNLTGNPLRRVVVPLYISYDTDIKFAMKVAMGVLKKHPKILKKPAPSVIVSEYGDSTINLSARFWAGARDGWFKIKSDVLHQMWDEFTAAGIVVPYNITHMETEQDTAAFTKEAALKTAKRKEEMALSKAMAAGSSGAANGVAAEVSAQNGAVPAVAAAMTSTPLAAASVPVEPEGAFADQTEIDGQA